MDSVVKIGIIGLGGMGKAYCSFIDKLEHAKLVAVCDINENVVQEITQQFHVAGFTDYKEMIASSKCNLMCVVTPHPLHYEVVYECIKAGLNVICEKPITERVSTAKKLIDFAKKKKVVFAIMFQRRFDYAFQKAYSLIKEGTIGEIYRTALFDMQYRTQCYYDANQWRGTWKGEGGGVLVNQSPHMLDILIYLTGMPSCVYGQTLTRFHSIETEDYAEALLRYKNGATGYVYCSTCEPRIESRLEIYGDKGKLIWRDGKLFLFRFEPSVSEHLKSAKDPWASPKIVEVSLYKDNNDKSQVSNNVGELNQDYCGTHIDVLKNVVEHILFNKPLINSAESSIGSLELANAIILSSYTGKWISLPLNTKRYDNLLANLRKKSKVSKESVSSKITTDPKVMSR